MKTKIIAASLALTALFGVGVSATEASFGSGAAVIAAKTSLVKGAISGEKVSFTDSDFKAALGITDFKSLTVTSLPDGRDGILVYAGKRVKAGDTVKRRYIPSLVFLPASGDVTETRFTFTVKGYSDESIECIIRFTPAKNGAPTLEGESKSVMAAQAGIGIGGVIEATDPDGDELEYFAVSYPEHGTLEISADGRYLYTPYDGFCGKDGFAYAVRDSFGNWSDIGRVSVTVSERASSAIFSDMAGRSEYAAALLVDAKGILRGVKNGEETLFMPDKELTRAELVTAALKSIGERVTEGASYFDDDGDIPDECRPYVAKAAAKGLICGRLTDGGLNFSPNVFVTRYEAARLAVALLGLDGSEESSEYLDLSDVPSHSRWAVDVAYTKGLLDPKAGSACELLTRAEAAVMLARLAIMV